MMARVEHDALVVQLRAELDQARAEVDGLRAALLERSGERDRQTARWLAEWAGGYQAGFESGAEVGYGQAVNDWKITARNTGMYDVSQHGPTWAELDRRRYPSMTPGVPAGRLGWIIPNLGKTWAAWSALDDGDEAHP
jgi:hypothetical protein